MILASPKKPMASQGSSRVTKIRVSWIHDWLMSIKPKELQWFWCVSQSANEPMSQSANLPTSHIGVRWSGTKKCSQRYEIDHFCLGIFAGIQPSNVFRDPVGESSVLPIRYPIYRWHQAEAWEVFGIGGWYVLSCTPRQISKYAVRAYGVCVYVIQCNPVQSNPFQCNPI